MKILGVSFVKSRKRFVKYNEVLVDIEANSSATSYDSTTELERQNGNENEIGNAITKLFLYRILFTKYRLPKLRT